MNIAIFRTAAFAALIGSPALAADQKFQGELDPMPHDNSTRTIVVGSGIVTGMLSGNQLTLSGKFSGLSSPATGAHLNRGLALGVPGAAIAALDATKAVQGTISGTVRLSRDAIAALKKNALYVELDSERAPQGNSWGWLQALDGQNVREGKE